MQTAFSKLDTGKLGTSNQRMPGRWVVFLSQNHLQLQALLLSSVAWAAESLSSHTARSCALVVLAHLHFRRNSNMY